VPVKEPPDRKTGAGARPRSDRELVEGCRRGREEDWSALVDKYKNLIFSIPIRYGLTREEATDIFQSVCLELIQELSKLRDPKALPKWLMQVTAHKCFHWRRQQTRMVSQDDSETTLPEMTVAPTAELILREVEEEQMLREALAELPARCRELIHMLFFEEESRPYQQVAATLGLATGSIGLVRQKCLQRLKKRLDTLGFT
jgi:RNA polymerase sigma factor (sigma-70 family)